MRLCEVTDPDLVARRLGHAGWALYASREYLARKGRPSSIHDLLGHEIVGYDDSLSDTVGARWLREQAAAATVVLRANGTATVTSAVIAGLGIAPLPFIIGDREAQLVRSSSDVLGSSTITLVTHPDLTLVARVRKTKDFLAEAFERDARL